MTRPDENAEPLDRDMARIFSRAQNPPAPPLPSGFAVRLARRAHPAEVQPDLTLPAVILCGVCLLILTGVSLAGLPISTIRSLFTVAGGINLALGPLGALAVIIHAKRENHAQA
jgi:hypothetical protein